MTDTPDTGQAPAQTLDVKGAACPIPVVKAAVAIKSLASGELLEILATDPGFAPDVEAWTKQTGNELVELDESGADGVYRALVRKA